MAPGSYELDSAPLAGFTAADVRVWTARLHADDPHERRVLARRMRAQVLEELTGRSVVTIAIAPGGKPHLPDGAVQFNLSHSGELACLATSPTVAVGVDVERLRVFRNAAGMRRRICHPDELTWLERLPAAGLQDAADPQAAALIRLWVRKEAVVKASGEGIVRDLNQFSALGDVVDDGRGGRWQCVDLPSPAPGYVAAVAFPAASR